MTKVLVIQGAGMNMRGKAQVEIFGPDTLDQINEQVNGYAEGLGLDVEFFHSNIEGEVVNALYDAHEKGIDAALINPGRLYYRHRSSAGGHRPGGLSGDRGPRLQSHLPGHGLKHPARIQRLSLRLRRIRLLPGPGGCEAHQRKLTIGWQTPASNPYLEA